VKTTKQDKQKQQYFILNLLETFEITAYKVDNRYTEHKTGEDGKDACYTCKQ
jgi:hypothetical protein